MHMLLGRTLSRCLEGRRKFVIFMLPLVSIGCKAEQFRYKFYYVCIAVLHTLVARLLARSQYLKGPMTGHLGTGFSCFPCV